MVRHAPVGRPPATPVPARMTTSLLVVDALAVIREGLVAVLRHEPDFAVVGEAESGEQALVDVARLRPDVVILAERLPVMSGHEACSRIADRHPTVAVIVSVAFLDRATVAEALRCGAKGVLLKDSEPATIRGAVRTVAGGKPFVDPRAQRRAAPPAPFGLTPRELTVLRVVAGGLSNYAIGRKLGITEDTVKTHVKSILVKLGAQGRTEAAAIAFKHGLV